MSNQTEREALVKECKDLAFYLGTCIAGIDFRKQPMRKLLALIDALAAAPIARRMTHEPGTNVSFTLSEEALKLDAKEKRSYRKKDAPQVAQEPVASSKCPICGHDKPHGHGDSEIAGWLRAQAGRFLPDWQRRIIIELGDGIAKQERERSWLYEANVDRADSERTFDDMVAQGFSKDEAYRRMCQGSDREVVQLRERIYQLERAAPIAAQDGEQNHKK